MVSDRTHGLSDLIEEGRNWDRRPHRGALSLLPSGRTFVQDLTPFMHLPGGAFAWHPQVVGFPPFESHHGRLHPAQGNRSARVMTKEHEP